tara:strand:- start:3074 stop:3259 length:186 start_codon:yes stop_codon:yes gene_type:complete
MRYKVTLFIETENGNPRKWDWEELIGDNILSVSAERGVEPEDLAEMRAIEDRLQEDTPCES